MAGHRRNPNWPNQRWIFEQDVTPDDRLIVSAEAVEEVKPAGAPDALDDQLIGQLVDRAKADGIKLTGQAGCCSS